MASWSKAYGVMTDAQHEIYIPPSTAQKFDKHTLGLKNSVSHVEINDISRSTLKQMLAWKLTVFVMTQIERSRCHFPAGFEWFSLHFEKMRLKHVTHSKISNKNGNNITRIKWQM